MSRVLKAAVAAVFVLVLAGASFAADRRPAEAKAFVKKAVAFVRTNGRDRALDEFNNPRGRFVNGELYVLAYDFNGVLLAHPFRKDLNGRNLLNLQDEDGKMFVREFIKAGKKGSGWVSYKWVNPTSRKIEPKTTYLESVNGIIVGCGVYK